MSDKFQNKSRIASARMQNWDYGSNAAYFITICTKNRVHYFGEVVDGVMALSEIGRIAEQEWIKTFEMRPDMNLGMGEYVVMPNHFHAIVVIGPNQFNGGLVSGRDAMHCVSTETKPNSKKNAFGPQSKNLSSIARGFKIGVTVQSRLILPNFAWQSRFHDHIIRDATSFNTISNYIRNNPKNWKNDTFWNG